DCPGATQRADWTWTSRPRWRAPRQESGRWCWPKTGWRRGARSCSSWARCRRRGPRPWNSTGTPPARSRITFPGCRRLLAWRTHWLATEPGKTKKPAADAVGFLFFLARPEGFEPPTPKFVAWCSIQLSYGRVVEKL